MAARLSLQILPQEGFAGQARTVFGALAQLGERLICIQEVRSSILLGSTKPVCLRTGCARQRFACKARASPGAEKSTGTPGLGR